MRTLEIKVLGKEKAGRSIPTIEYIVMEIDWESFKVILSGTNRDLIGDGKIAFSILKGQRRRKILEKLGYDPDLKEKVENGKQ
jgi:hypothetical protein